jgi:hypothetical protein
LAIKTVAAARLAGANFACLNCSPDMPLVEEAVLAAEDLPFKHVQVQVVNATYLCAIAL